MLLCDTAMLPYLSLCLRSLQVQQAKPVKKKKKTVTANTTGCQQRCGESAYWYILCPQGNKQIMSPVGVRTVRFPLWIRLYFLCKLSEYNAPLWTLLSSREIKYTLQTLTSLLGYLIITGCTGTPGMKAPNTQRDGYFSHHEGTNAD